ncbi:unnamed protein product [Cylicostephanus goldi]|uniref:Beta-lactamase-related domain-containing protein n=1 Tax=Cylicostephanus goldi TaxID=71465 RepID=A0A3P6R0S5_CYLGO|nr:unnamed protein product [Cylicostephanus goldi]
MYRYERDGAALAMYYKGKLVVDLWGGWADRMNERSWTQNTMANIFCCTKVRKLKCAGKEAETSCDALSSSATKEPADQANMQNDGNELNACFVRLFRCM